MNSVQGLGFRIHGLGGSLQRVEVAGVLCVGFRAWSS